MIALDHGPLFLFLSTFFLSRFYTDRVSIYLFWSCATRARISVFFDDDTRSHTCSVFSEQLSYLSVKWRHSIRISDHTLGDDDHFATIIINSVVVFYVSRRRRRRRSIRLYFFCYNQMIAICDGTQWTATSRIIFALSILVLESYAATISSAIIITFIVDTGECIARFKGKKSKR